MTDLPKKLELALHAHRAGQLEAAASAYRQILQAYPNHPDAAHLLGLIRQQQSAHLEAAALFSQAIASNPKAAAFRINRGVSLRALSRIDEAITDFQAAIQLERNLAEAHHQLGNSFKALRRSTEAVQSLREASRLDPVNGTIWLNLGVALLDAGAAREAVEAFRTAVRLQPGRPEAHNVLGHALLTLGQSTEARRELEQALTLRPKYAAAHDNLGRVFRFQGRMTEAIEQFRAAVALQPLPGTHSNLVYALNFSPGFSPSEIFQEHRRWGELHAKPVTQAIASRPGPTRNHARLRIGYVSPDLIHHAVSYFIEPVLTNHDRANFEVYCYHNAPTSDRVTARLRALGPIWHDIANLTDDQVAAQIRADEIDILVDLAGHTARHRLLVFARRVAPVQVTWLGYPNTTGLDSIDYRITDAVSDPIGKTDQWHSEKLVRLPESFSCYLPPAESPSVAPLPALRNSFVTFGSFNHFAKLTPQVISLWARVLLSVPRSRLFIKARSLADADTARELRLAFGHHGIDPTRLELSSDELSVFDHLALYDRVDIALDPFPYNGTTTTCEALWMGVPIVTLAGETHVARVGASLLTHLGRPEWIASQDDEYVRIAAGLAGDTVQLAFIRSGLRETMRSSPLCDGPGFVRNLENAYRAMMAAKLSPDSRTALP